MVHYFGLKCALLHAKFQKNCWSGFRDNPGRTHGRTDGGYFIGPFGFQPGTNNLAPVYMADIFVKSNISRRTTRYFNESNLVLPRRVNGYGQNCLSYLGPTVWNNIPDETREINTCNTFKHKTQNTK